MTIPAGLIRSAMDRMLEEMYFRTGSWTGPGTLDPSTIGARVTFSGSFSGEFRVLATTGFSAQLAADFLGADASEITDSQAVSLVREFANIACGATLNDWMPDANFHFSIPSSLTAEEERGNWPYRFCAGGNQPELAFDLVVFTASTELKPGRK